MRDVDDEALPQTPLRILKLHAKYIEKLMRAGIETKSLGGASGAGEISPESNEVANHCGLHSQPETSSSSRVRLPVLVMGVSGGEQNELAAAKEDSRILSQVHSIGGIQQSVRGDVCLYDGTLVMSLDRETGFVWEVVDLCCRTIGIGNDASRYLALHMADERGQVSDNWLAFDLRVRKALLECEGAFKSSGIMPPITETGSQMLVLCVRLWTRELSRRVTSGAVSEAGLVHVVHAQAVASVVSDAWPCPMADAALVAAVQLSGHAVGGESATSVVRRGLHGVLPARILESHDWELDVLVELRFRLNDVHASPRADLLAVCQTWDTFGAVDLGEAQVFAMSEAALCPAGALGRVRLGHAGIEVVLAESMKPLVFALRRLDRWEATKADEISFDWTPPNGPASLSDSEVAFSTSALKSCGCHRALCAVRCKLVGVSQAEMACRLLDDYAALDFLEEPPAHRYVKPAMSSRASSVSALYDSLVAAIIRPPRSIYEMRRLGPSSFELAPGVRIHRKDIILKNATGCDLHCSHWHPARSVRKLPCVVFLHANSASRVQALHYARTVLSLGASFFAFDCQGSGLSDGTYVSLGWNEARDLDVAARYLRNLGTVSSLSAWGCSMGAAAIIFHMGTAPGASTRAFLHPPKKGASTLSSCNLTHQSATHVPQMLGTFDAVVLDSPYSDVTQLALDLAASKLIAGFTAPRLLAKTLLHLVEKSVRLLQSFSIYDLKPINVVPRCHTPALFLHAECDQLVKVKHVEALIANYAGPRVLALVDGSHSTPRLPTTLTFIQQFLTRNALQFVPPNLQGQNGHITLLPFLQPRLCQSSLSFPPGRLYLAD